MPNQNKDFTFHQNDHEGQPYCMSYGNKRKKTVPMQKVKEIGTVFLFCLLLPYVVATMTGRAGSGGSIREEQDTIFVLYEDAGGTEKIPLDTFLTGALAASIDSGMLDETIKAQAVVLRSTVMEAYGRRSDKNNNCVTLEEVGLEYYDTYQLRRNWVEDFEDNYNKMKRIVEETDGIVMTYQGIPVYAPYFYVSAGRTRNGNEIYTKGEYPYLQTVESLSDFNCPGYGSSVLFPKRYFTDKMAKLFGLSEDVRPALDDFTLQKDSAGYVSTVRYAGSEATPDKNIIPGDYVKEALELKSSHFVWEERKEGILIQVQGVGHGLGFSQYGANEMAKKGDTYEVLLKYYFHDIEIQKY